MSKAKRRERGQIVARGTSRWLVRVYLGQDPETGKRSYASEAVSGTRKDAEVVRTRLLASVDAGEHPSALQDGKQGGDTLGEFLVEWLTTVAKPNISARTYHDYNDSLTRYVLPTHGKLPLASVNKRAINSLYSGLSERGYSPNTIRLVHAPLRQALQTAVDWELILKNPTVGVKRPIVKRGGTPRQTLTMAQVDLFLETYREDHRYYALWVLLLFSGLRPGEALALKWVDLRGPKLTTQRALTQTDTRVWGVGPTKTEDSTGTITLPEVAVKALQGHRKWQAREILRAGEDYDRESGWMFSDARGEHLRPDTVTQRWARHLKRLGLPHMRLYDTRHTHATLLLEAGVNPKVVSARLRHASVAITLDTYSHVLAEVEEGVADTLDELFDGARKGAKAAHG